MQKEIEIIVPFYDLDPMRVVWHGNYLKYMEGARCALLDEYSLNYDDMAKLGYAFPVVTMQAKYIKPAIFGQKIIVKITHISNENFLIFKYEISDANTHDKIFTAETKQMVVNIETHESCFQLPEPFLKIFGGVS
ncbi:MAG: acyl-CoA thioesterase [Alphaproteobacteria bacterium]|nr:acyl-CoA thioesterase [Alphaproteobacteria bacterium]